jgi:hypothetical protein
MYPTPPIEERCPTDPMNYVFGFGCNRLATASGEVSFDVVSGPLNREGAAYLILVLAGGGPFVVVESHPAPSDGWVDPRGAFHVTFSELVDVATVAPETFRVTVGGSLVAGTYSVAGNLVTFVPTTPLEWAAAGEVYVTSGVRDLAGDPLAEPFSSQFTTRPALDFSVAADLPQISVVQGGTAGAEIVFTVTAGAPEPVALSVSGCPPAAECMLSPPFALAEPISTDPFMVEGTFVEAVALRVVTSPSTPPGTYAVDVAARAPLVTREARVDVTVSAPPDAGMPRRLWGDAGVGVSIAPGYQAGVSAAPDGAGGLLLAWEDGRHWPGLPFVYSQRLDARGVPLWRAQGVPIALPPVINSGYSAAQRQPAILPDGEGGAFVAFEKGTILGGGVQYDIYAQRLAADGTLRWGPDGVPVATACWGGLCANQKRYPQILADGAGGAIIVWEEMRNGFTLSIYAQRLGPEGSPAWILDGVPVQDGAEHAMFPRAVPDGAGGAVVAWVGDGVFAQRIGENGVPLWSPGGVDLQAALAQVGGGHALTSDGRGGAVVAWVDGRTPDPVSDSDIMAARIAADGTLPWGLGGVRVCSRPLHQYSPTVASDGAAGAFVAWEDQGASPPGSGQQWILAQRVDGSGTALWQENGVVLSDGHSFGPTLAPDGSGGVLAAWNDFLQPVHGRVQRLDGSGRAFWGANGFGAVGNGVELAGDAPSGVFVFFLSETLPPPWPSDLAAQRVGEQ